jgi:hypothetical protein
MVVPDRWLAYECSDYFSSPLAQTGWFDVDGQYWYVEPVERLVEDAELHFLVIGGPGVDGIRWGYRRGERGVWAFFPIEAEFRLLAPSVADLVEGYGSGRITV